LENQLLVIFGASGDLTKRKLMPALFELYRQHHLPTQFAILGIGRTAFSSESFRDNMKSAIQASVSPEDQVAGEIDQFAGLLHYLSIETSQPDDYILVRDKVMELDAGNKTDGNYLFYLATPPDLSGIIANNLSLRYRIHCRCLLFQE